MDKKAQFFPYKDENPREKFPFVTVTLIAVNVLVFLYSLTDFEQVISTFGFTPLHPALLTVFTSMFLHGGIEHIFGNMWYMWTFGDNVEDRLGRLYFIVFYILSGIAATLLHYLTNIGSDIPTIGASGAISGILGAYLALFPHVKIHVAGRFGFHQISAVYMIGFWFILQLILGSFSLFDSTGAGIAFWAHVGGFVFGYVVMWVLVRMEVVRR
ncbi:rhomboid family intramembrane serine protease [Candidatus Woesearchaeota archaeon]|nr:rhomboid family intramembrane serine protease [Candidatus Woesearchaeota archaeon]